MSWCLTDIFCFVYLAPLRKVDSRMSFISFHSASSVHAPLTDDAPLNLSTNARHNRYVVITTEYEFKKGELKDRTALANY